MLLAEALMDEAASPLPKSDMVDLTSGPATPEPVQTEEEKMEGSKEKEKVKKTPGRKLVKKSKEEKKKGPEVQQSTMKFADIGGNEKTLQVCIYENYSLSCP